MGAVVSRQTITATGQYRLVEAGTGYGQGGWQIAVVGSSWTGSGVLKQRTSPPGSAVALGSAITYYLVTDGSSSSAAITAAANVIVQDVGSDLYFDYTHTSGTVTITVMAAGELIGSEEGMLPVLNPVFAGTITGPAIVYSTKLSSITALATPSALAATAFNAFASTVSGAAIMGYGTTNDVSLMNRAGTVCLGVGPNTTTVNVPGGFTVGAQLTCTIAGTGLFHSADGGNALMSMAAWRDTNAGNAAFCRITIGNNASAVAADLAVYSSAHSTRPDYVRLVNQRNAPLLLGGYGTEMLSLGNAAATLTGTLTINGSATMVGDTPASVGTTPATAATATALGTGIGGNTTIATIGVGGKGGDYSVTTGAGGTAAVAVTAGTGGAGGDYSVTTGAGAVSAVTGAGTGTGGKGGALAFLSGEGGAASTSTGVNLGGASGAITVTTAAGGAATNGSSNTGGASGVITIATGNGGAGATAQGASGALTLQTGASTATVGSISLKPGGLSLLVASYVSATVGQVLIDGTYGAGVASLRLNGLTDAAGGNTGTLTNCPHTGNPSFWAPVSIAGTVYAVPCFALT